jgi:hypothetical protein
VVASIIDSWVFFFLHFAHVYIVIISTIICVVFASLLYFVCSFNVAIVLLIYGTNNALWASKGFIPYSHNKVASFCNYNMVHFILVITILREDCNPIRNIVPKKMSMVGACNPRTNFCMCS